MSQQPVIYQESTNWGCVVIILAIVFACVGPSIVTQILDHLERVETIRHGTQEKAP